MKEYFLSVNDHGVYVKDGQFFREQGGTTSEWGKNWQRVEAESMYKARNIGIRLRRERFPNAHMTLGEDGEPPELYWPEAKGA